jgi:sigma-E factor negative regulatory protein RseA
MDDSWRAGEMVSDMMDGRLSESEFSEAAHKVATHAEARELWHSYHLVGDVLRSGDLAPHADDAGFLSRFQQRLHDEVLLHPVPLSDSSIPLSGAFLAADFKAVRAANDGRFSWKWVAGLGAMVVVAAAGWNMAGDNHGAGSSQQLANAPATRAVVLEASTEGQVMIRDPRLDRLLMAHRQSAGQSALQVSSGFLRNATFEVSSHPAGN